MDAQQPATPAEGDQTTATTGTTTATDDAAQDGATAQLAQLRAMVTKARAMPMSASCVIHRGDALSLIDAIAAALPDELGRAQTVLDGSQAEVSRAREEGHKIVAAARDEAAELARHSSVMEQARQQADALLAEARTEAAELRTETNTYIDERMANFESVLHKTVSQVRTYRQRLADHAGPEPETE